MSDSASLAVVLAQTTARLLPWSKEQETHVASNGVAGDYIDHGFVLCCEIATDALTRLGVMQHVRGPFYALRIDVDNVDSFAAAVLGMTLPMDQLISAFLGMVDHRGLIPMQQDAVFEPPENCMAAMRARSEAGYSDRAGSLFSWNEKIRPAMSIQHFWPATQNHR